MKAITHRYRERKKKGEITSQQIVILIVLIASFAILLFFLFRLNLGEETDKELCRNSVLLKGKSVFKDSTLLNCKKSYVCLTADGNCDSSDLIDPELKKVKTKNDTYRVLADEMRDCWWMFGEGKVNYVGDDLTRNNYCSICSQFVFDDSSKEIFDGGVIDKKEFYKFLRDNNLTGSDVSYLGYLYGIGGIAEIEKNLTDGGTGFGEIGLTKEYFVAMGIKSSSSKTQWIIGGALAGATVVGGILAVPFTLGASIPVSIGLITTFVGGVAGGIAGSELVAVTVTHGENDFIIPTIISPDDFKTLNCEEVITLS